MNRSLLRSALVTFLCLNMAAFAATAQAVPQKTINLPTSKQLLSPAPGDPQQLNSLPMVMTVSPDGRYVVTVNAGFGTFESDYMQSIAVLDTVTGKLADFPDKRTPRGASQTLYSGLAFSLDGKHIYASIGSLTAPTGGKAGQTGNAIAVYAFDGTTVTPERLLPIPLQLLAPGKTQHLLPKSSGPVKAIPFPAGLAVTKSATGAEELLVADNLSDNVLLMDTATGKILQRFDLSTNTVVPSVYPIAVTVSRNGAYAYVALWNGSEIAELDLRKGTVSGGLALLKPRVATAPGSHPSALTLSPDGKTLYVVLTNRDAVAAVNVTGGRLKLRGYFDTKLPGQSYFGAEPEAVAVSPDGGRLYVANSASDDLAIFATKSLKGSSPANGMAKPLGFVPTEWYPTAVVETNGKLYVTTAKGKGTGPNNMPQRQVPGQHSKRSRGPSTYIATLLHGSLATLDPVQIERELPKLSEEVLVSNRMHAAEEKMDFHDGHNPIKHVIYIIKENRTYDQLFGDLQYDGKPIGNGDPSLTMYGKDITPNQHKLALQFGILDNFFDSGEVSGDGHVWSTAAINSDYNEKTWEQSYRGGQRTYDYEGVVANGYPLLQGIPDIDEPGSGYLWTDLAAHHKTYYHFGEFISTKFCDDSGEAPKEKTPQEGTPQVAPALCGRNFIHRGESIPAVYGGGISQYPWPIPLVSKNTATKPELVGHFDPTYADFNLHFPDQLRVNDFLNHFHSWVKDREQGQDGMPQFVMLRLPNDHTAGTTPGGPTPKSSIADNDLAIGRAVEAVSHSPYWNDTAFFILEDDAQAGADHVDAHRSIALVISKYSPRAKEGAPFVDSHFYTTVSVLRTIENLLGLPPMNNNDAFAPLIAPLFTGAGDEPVFNADYSNRDNGLIYTANKRNAPGAKASSKMDFKQADMADTQKLNVILWKDAMGSKPVPAMLLQKHKKHKDDDDD
ncbi:MAG: beta-propeller fold lactonase family protein [Acidobacteriaceae bacterium]